MYFIFYLSAKFFSEKKRLALQLSASVAEAHDEWYQEVHRNRSNSSTSISGLSVSKVLELGELGEDVYKDADLPHTLPQQDRIYNK